MLWGVTAIRRLRFSLSPRYRYTNMSKYVLDIYIHLSQEWILWVLNSYYESTDTLQGQNSRRKNSMAHPNVYYIRGNFKFGKSSNARWWRLPVRGAVVVALPVWSESVGQWDVFAFCRLLQLKLFKPPSVEIVSGHGQDFFLCLEKASASCQPEKEVSITCLIAQVVTEWSNLTWHHCSQPERPNNKGFESVAFRSKFTYFSNTHSIHNIHQFEAKRWDIRCLWDQQIGRGWNVPFRTDTKLL